MLNEFILALEEILDLSEGSLTENTDFKLHPEWDSLAALSTLVMIEDKYKKVIDPSILANSNTIGELIANIEMD